MLDRVRTMQQMGYFQHINSACSSCNVCQDGTLFSRLEALYSILQNWLLEIVGTVTDDFQLATLYDIDDIRTDIGQSCCLIQTNQTIVSSWEHCSQSYVDITSVAGMLRIDKQQSPSAVHIVYPQSLDIVVEQLGFLNERPVLSIDELVLRMLASMTVAMETVVLPMIGDSHFRLVIFIMLLEPFCFGILLGKLRSPCM